MTRMTTLIRAAVLCAIVLALPAGELVAQVDLRITAVENGLLPHEVEKGSAGKPVSLLERMAELGVPGLSLAVIEGGEIAWARGYGVMDFESERPVTRETLFLAGSISKPVSAVGALRLVRDGKLTLDGDVNQWLSSWKLPPSDALGDKHVSLRALLTHSAGLTVQGFPGYSRSAEIPSVPQILDGAKPANTAAVRVDLEPGTEWRYSGGGYTVMQLLVADVADEPFHQYLAKAVLEPFGMAASSFENPLPESRHSLAATGYFTAERKVTGSWHVYPEMAAAGLWTTASDLARFAIGIQRAAAGSSTVLDQKATAAMLAKHQGDWGLGPSLSGEGRTRRFGHGGRDAGFDARLVAYVETGQGAAVMINANDNSGLLSELVAAVARAYEWQDFPSSEQKVYVPLAEAKLREYAANYVREDGEGEFRVFVWEEKLYLTPRLGTRLELLAEEEQDRFFVSGMDGWLRFERDEEGSVTRVEFSVFGSEGRARRE